MKRIPAICCMLALLWTFTGNAKAETCTDIQTYGGNGNGIVDNSNALNSALAALGTSGGCISFPAGNYYFSAGVTYNLGLNQGVQLIGSGPHATALNFGFGGIEGLAFGFSSANNSLQVRSMTISTLDENPVALSIAPSSGWPVWSNVPSLIEDVILTGPTAGWVTGLQISGLSNISISRTQFLNTWNAIYVQSNNDVANLDIKDCLFAGAPAIELSGGHPGGIETLGNIQNLSVEQSYFTDPNMLAISMGVNVSAVTTMSITSNNFSGPVNLSDVNSLILSDNTFAGPPGNGNIVSIASSEYMTITNNHLIGADGLANGLYLGSSSYGVIAGNVFDNLHLGWILDSNTTGINVQSNAYYGGTVGQNYGTGNTIGGSSQFWERRVHASDHQCSKTQPGLSNRVFLDEVGLAARIDECPYIYDGDYH